MKAQMEQDRYVIFLNYGLWAGLIAHVLFVLIFVLLDSPLLAFFNFFSISVFAGSLRLLARKKITVILWLVTLEIILHAGLAVREFGWNSGFHYYILTLIMVSAFLPEWKTRSKIAYLSAVCLTYLLLNQWSLTWRPRIEVSAYALDGLRWFNTVFIFAFISYLAHFYAKAARDAEQKLELLASTDSLTGLYNRRHMQQVFEQEKSKLQRSSSPLSIIMIDIDNFKNLNDQCGHDCGDLALQKVAGCFCAILRKHDYAARWGGEEFLLLLPGTGLQGALVLAEKVRSLTSELPLDVRGEERHITLTLSVGELKPDEDFGHYLTRVDHGLLAGKQAGKNRVVVV